MSNSSHHTRKIPTLKVENLNNQVQMNRGVCVFLTDVSIYRRAITFLLLQIANNDLTKVIPAKFTLNIRIELELGVIS